MAKTVKRKEPANSVELRRWCVEMATRWPQTTISRHGNGGMAYGGGNFSSSEIVEADVIGRAKKLHDWVTSAK